MLGWGIAPTAKSGEGSVKSRSYLNEFWRFEKIFLKKNQDKMPYPDSEIYLSYYIITVSIVEYYISALHLQKYKSNRLAVFYIG